MGLNHIYKVIWSKTKNAWVVVSEIAKRDGKSSVKSVVTSLAGKSVAAVMVAMVMCGGVASAFNHVGTNIVIGGDSLAVGEDIDSGGGQSLAIGIRAKSDGSGTTLVIGNDSKVVHTGMVVGNQSEGTYVIGQQSKGSFVLGNYSNSNHGGMVLGNHNSDDGIDASQTTYAPINGVQLNYGSVQGRNVGITQTLSVGNKNAYQFTRITNVAAGNIDPYSTDAINGSQLYEAVRAITAGASPDVYMHVNDGTTTQGAGSVVGNSGKINEKGGATGKYSIAIGMNNTRANGESAIAIGKNSQALSDTSIALGTQGRFAENYGVDANSKGSILIGGGQITYANDAITLGTGSKVTGNTSNTSENSIAIGRRSSVFGSQSSISMGFNSRISQGAKNIAIGDNASVALSFIQGPINSGISDTKGDASNSVAIGSSANASGGSNSVAIGYQTATIGTDNSNAIGYLSQVIPTDNGTSLIYGSDNSILGNRSQIAGGKDIMVIGNRIRVINDPTNSAKDYSGAVVIGSDSEPNAYVKPTDTTINGITLSSNNYAGQGTTSTP